MTMVVDPVPFKKTLRERHRSAVVEPLRPSLGQIDIQRFGSFLGVATVNTRYVTPGSFRGLRFRELKSLDFAEPWMPEHVRHEEKG